MQQGLQAHGCDRQLHVDFAPEPGRVNVITQYGLPLVELRPLAFSRGQEIVKRGFDIFASTLALIFFGADLVGDRSLGEVHLRRTHSLQGGA